jgi:hypothetical protein
MPGERTYHKPGHKSRVASRKVSMGFLRERDFSRDQPCETRLLARLESRMVSRDKFAEVVGTRRVSGERHVLYLTYYVRTEQVWSRMSRETGLARRDHGLAVSSRVSSRKVSQQDATLHKRHIKVRKRRLNLC